MEIHVLRMYIKGLAVASELFKVRWTMKNVAKFVILGTLAVCVATAQDDPPGRVARLNYISGPVSFQPSGVDDWVNATINRPLTTGDHLWTDRAARADLHVGPAALRLGPETAFEFLNLDDK